MNTMNSYFEQNGFYSHPHQTAGGMGMAAAAAAHHDQSAATAAYRGFPLSLGMTPYGQHHLHQSSASARAAQESPYDASITAACTKLYDNAYNNKDCAKTGIVSGASSGGGGGGNVGNVGNVGSQDTNGYKDVWNTGSVVGNNGGVGNVVQNSGSVPVRPSACTPDSRVGGYLDTSGGSPVSRSGGGGGLGSASLGGVGVGGGGGGGVGGGVSANAWNTSQCSIGGAGQQAAASAAAAAGLHQASNHTFYPWMAIAGMYRHQPEPSTVREGADPVAPACGLVVDPNAVGKWAGVECAPKVLGTSAPQRLAGEVTALSSQHIDVITHTRTHADIDSHCPA